MLTHKSASASHIFTYILQNKTIHKFVVFCGRANLLDVWHLTFATPPIVVAIQCHFGSGDEDGEMVLQGIEWEQRSVAL